MQVTLSPKPLSLVTPVETSAVDQNYLHRRMAYEKQRRAQALRLRRQLVRQRGIFQRRLERALSPALRSELNIQVVLDSQYLQRPGFIAVFEDLGNQWILNFQANPFGGRWYFRAGHSSKLYACSSRHLETQLCYALGQDRMYSCCFARA